MANMVDLPFPSNEDLFEDLCQDLWELILNDPDIQRNGRKGSKQKGVDIFGCSEDGKIVGIQCKKKDHLTNKQLEESEIEKEVEKAKKFEPPLSKYIIATTAVRNSGIQEFTRKISEKNRKKGLFSVHVYSWEDITRKLHDYPKLKEKYGLESIIDKTPETLEIMENQINKFTELDALIRKKLELSPDLPTIHRSNLEYAKELINNQKPEDALNLLEKIEKDIWNDVPNSVKYEILRLKGFANHNLLKNDEAGRLLIEALQYNPHDEKAKCNHAFGLLLIDELEKAKKEAELILRDNLTNIDALQILILSSTDTDLKKTIQKIPTSLLKNEDIAYTIGIRARETYQFKESEKWLRIALDNSEKASINLKGNLGEVILENTLKNQYILSNQISLDDYGRLLESSKFLKEAWDSLKFDDKLKKSRISWIVNKSTANRILGNYRSALNDIDEAITLDPDDCDHILKKSIILSNLEEYENAEKILIKLDKQKCPNAILFLAHALMSYGNNSEAIKVLTENQKILSSAEALRDATNMLINLYLAQNEIKKAKKAHDSYYGTDNTDINGLIHASRILKTEQKFDESSLCLKKALKIEAENNSSILDQQALANEFYYNADYENALKILKKIVDTGVESELNKKLVDCYYKLGDIGSALKITSKLREIYKKPLEDISEIEIAILAEIDSYDEAKDIYEEYAKLYPLDLQMQINKAYIDLRSEDYVSVDDFLNSKISIEELSIDDFVRLINLYHLRNFDKLKISEMLYEMRRRFYSDKRAHAEYIKMMIFFRIGQELTLIKSDLETAVCLEYENGEIKWYVLENKDNIDVNLDETYIKGPIGKNIVGKYLGEEITIQRGAITQKATITEIKSKYIHACHKSFEHSDHFFEYGLQSFPLSDSPGKYKHLEGAVNLKENRFNDLKKAYLEQKCTLINFIESENLCIVDSIQNIIRANDMMLYVKSNHFNMDYHVSLIDSNQIIIDLISLITIFNLDVQDVVIKAFGKIGIAQSTIDIIKKCIYDKKEFLSRSSSSLTKINGKLAIKDNNLKDQEDSLKFLEEILAWIQKNCKVFPVYGALNISRKVRNMLNNNYGKHSVDSILIANSINGLFFCEEEIIRDLSDKHLGAKSIWTQPLLLKCLQEGYIRKEEYKKAIFALIDSDYMIMG